MDDSTRQEERLKRALLKNDRKEALEILLDLITASAREKDFGKAEQFRDRLYDIDPMALSIIIRANEIIEEEKTLGVNPTHRELFAGLYDMLTPRQGNALFYALEETTVPQGQYIFRQGDASQGLFFVDAGKLRVECLQGNRSVFIKFLLPGSIFGSESFFSSSVSTTAIAAISDASLHGLGRKTFGRLKAEHPGLEGALKRTVARLGTVSEHLLQNHMDRREKTREAIFGTADIHLSSDSSQITGKPIRVDLKDISPKGASFLLRMSNEEKADILLGQKIVISYRSEAVSPPMKIQTPGTIVGITPNLFDDYAFHIKFDREFEPSQIERIVTVFGKKGG